MQTHTENKEMTKCTCTMEQELARLGARIDKLINRAAKVKEEIHTKVEKLSDKGKTTQKRSEAALHELRVGLDKAWEDLNQSWEDLKLGTERAVHELKQSPATEEDEECRAPQPRVPCGWPKHQLEEDPDLDLIV